jgi:hypothetical protein
VISLLHYKIRQILKDSNYQRSPKLILQVDNCFRENKNHYMLAYLGLLVHYKWFTEIEMHSLIQGHTHEDID